MTRYSVIAIGVLLSAQAYRARTKLKEMTMRFLGGAFFAFAISTALTFSAHADELLVTQAFEQYRPGQVITDAATISAILSGPYAGYVIHVNPGNGGGPQPPPTTAPTVTATYQGSPTSLLLGTGLGTDGTSLLIPSGSITAAMLAAGAALPVNNPTATGVLTVPSVRLNSSVPFMSAPTNAQGTSTVIGNNAGIGITTSALEATIVGDYAGGSQGTGLTGTEDTAIGWHSQTFNVSGTYMTSVGVNTLGQITTGGADTVIGTDDMRDSSGSNNVGAGDSVMRDGTYNNIVAIGSGALTNNGNAGANSSASVVIGSGAGPNGSGLTNDVFIGDASGLLATTGGGNVCVGHYSCPAITTGNSNVILGSFGGLHITGSNNTLMGANAGQSTNSTGTGNLLIAAANTVDTPANANYFTNIANQIVGSQATPTLSSCGSSTMNTNSTDINGSIVIANGTTSCTMTWALAKTAKPFVVVTVEGGGTAPTVTPSTTGVVIAGAAISNTTVDYWASGK